MKKYVKKLISLVLAGTMVLASVSVVYGAVPPTKIAIRSQIKTMAKGERVELDSKITPAKARVKDADIAWSSSDPEVLKVLDQYDDDTVVKALKAGKATITVQIKGTNLSAQKEITVKETVSTSSGSYAKKIAAYKSELKEIFKTIKADKPASSREGRYEQERKYEKKIEKIEDKLDILEDRIEAQYRAKKLTKKQFRNLDNKLEAVEDYISRIEDYIEDTFGDFDDDYDDDYDDYDD